MILLLVFTKLANYIPHEVSVSRGGGLPYEMDGDARRLA